MSSHPCQFSPEVLDVLVELIKPGERVHDPFAGPGVRLGRLCDRLGATFTGGDIEEWTNPPHDPRVVVADARDAASYPAEPFTVVTSPTYVNKRCADYKDGPTPTTKTKGRRDYGIVLGHPLHPANLARVTGRPSKAHLYWEGHAEAVKHWGDRAIVNVDEPISERWQELLVDNGYAIEDVLPAYTRRFGGLANADKRAEYEVVIVAHKEWPTNSAHAQNLKVMTGGLPSPTSCHHHGTVTGDPPPGVSVKVATGKACFRW